MKPNGWKKGLAHAAWVSGLVGLVHGCGGGGASVSGGTTSTTPTTPVNPGIAEFLNLDINVPLAYAATAFPVHYDADVFRTEDNTPGTNPITDKGAMLGRVLFHDKRLSLTDTVSCASCHQQPLGLGDSAKFSPGITPGSVTSAHSMRLGNVRFYTAGSMFWDKRAPTLEFQSTQPIQNTVEMGFDAAHGGMAALLTKMKGLSYYPELFSLVYGDSTLTEDRIQRALAQFLRSMSSTRSKWDDGAAQVYNPALPNKGLGAPLPNFTASENRGQQLFFAPPDRGGAGCVACHQAPSFALTANARSNGLTAGETTIFKAPSLKNIATTGPYMHDGSLATLETVVEHYNSGIQAGPALDNRLRAPDGQPLRLNLSEADKTALVDFLKTLEDPTLKADARFGNPFKK